MTALNEPITTVIEHLRRQGTDDAEYEAKACETSLSASVWSSVSAFANTSGGTLLLGLDETKQFTVPSSFNPNRIRDQFIEGIGDGGNGHARLTFPPLYNMERVEIGQKTILAVRIMENSADKKPCFVTAKGVGAGSYKRVDDKDIRLSATEIYELQHVLKPSTDDRDIVVDADKSDLDSAITTRIIKRRSDSKAFRGVRTEAEKLSRLNITDKQGKIRTAGLLVAGTYPQQFFPNLFIDVATHPGNEKYQSGQPRFLDRVLCEGPMAEMIADAVDATAKNLRTYSVVEGSGRYDELEIPREVLREAIANAVIHREYNPAFQGQQVSIDIYPNRVEITNPGGLWGGKTLENITDGESKCRNAAIIQLMRFAPLAQGNAATVEGQGSGVAFMIGQMQDRDLAQPEFRADTDHFTVVLWRNGVELSANRNWVKEHSHRTLTKRENGILLFARERGTISVHDVRTRLGYDSDDIRLTLEKLSNENLMKKAATDIYKIVDDLPEKQVEQLPSLEHDLKQPFTDTLLLNSMGVHKTFTVRELAEQFNKSTKTIQRALHRLQETGAVVSFGTLHSRNRRYARSEDDEC